MEPSAAQAEQTVAEQVVVHLLIRVAAVLPAVHPRSVVVRFVAHLPKDAAFLLAFQVQINVVAMDTAVHSALSAAALAAVLRVLLAQAAVAFDFSQKIAESENKFSFSFGNEIKVVFEGRNAPAIRGAKASQKQCPVVFLLALNQLMKNGSEFAIIAPKGVRVPTFDQFYLEHCL